MTAPVDYWEQRKKQVSRLSSLKRSVLIQWEVDAIKLSELLELAGVNAIGEKQPEFINA